MATTDMEIESEIEQTIASMSTDDIKQMTRLLDNEVRIMKSDISRIKHETAIQRQNIKDNREKVKHNKVLPYLVSNVVEMVDPYVDPNEDGSAMDSNGRVAGKGVVVKTTTRQTIFLPIPGLVRNSELRPNDLVGVNKDSFIIFEKLPQEFDTRVKAMEVDEKPQEEYTDIGGLDKQIQELIEAVVLPMTQAEKFKTIGIRAPKGVLLYGPPGTGKTLLARACAKSTDAVFLKLNGPQLVQMYIGALCVFRFQCFLFIALSGDGAKMIRDAFELAKDKIQKEGRKGAIIFIDELDAIGTKRYGGDTQAGDREIQRTMLELLTQLDGFASNDAIKVIAATNRPDVLDPALLRSGRLDRKVELPHPSETARVQIMKIHCRKMVVDMDDVNFEELARCTEDFNGAQLKAVCVESGMIALRREATKIKHEDFMEAITVVAAKKKGSLDYYA